MSRKTPLSHGRVIRRSVFIFWALSFLIISLHFSPAFAQEADTVPDASLNGKGRIGCTKCPVYSYKITQLLNKADALYASFKTKEAIDELLKILELDPDNNEALTKAARAFIDLGDMIPESTPDWNEKRLKQYLIAEQFGSFFGQTLGVGTLCAAKTRGVSFLRSVATPARVLATRSVMASMKSRCPAHAGANTTTGAPVPTFSRAVATSLI